MIVWQNHTNRKLAEVIVVSSVHVVTWNNVWGFFLCGLVRLQEMHAGVRKATKNENLTRDVKRYDQLMKIMNTLSDKTNRHTQAHKLKWMQTN